MNKVINMNKTNKGRKINGVDNIDTEEMRKMRQTVAEQELSARSWKAFYKKMYYSLESEKLEKPYAEYQERAKIRMAEEKTRMEEFMKNLNQEIAKKNEADPAGEIGLEEAN